MINAAVRGLVEAREQARERLELDQFINTWTCDRGGQHRVYRLCDCPGARIDQAALARGILQIERKAP
jgi:hypothetical protein